MYNFKAYEVNIYKTSPYNEGDISESMEAFINIYKDGIYDYIESPQIYVRLKGGKGYFRWCDNKIHEIHSLRSAAISVIQECVESIKKSKSYEDRPFLTGVAHNILNSLF